MKNKPNFFFDNRGFPNWGGGGPHIIPFFLITSLSFQTFVDGVDFMALHIRWEGVHRTEPVLDLQAQ